MQKVVVKLESCSSTIVDPEDIFIAGQCLIVKKDDKNEFSFPKEDVKDIIKIDENGNTSKAPIKILNDEETEEYIEKRIEKDKKDVKSRRIFLYYENFGRTEIEDANGAIRFDKDGILKLKTKKQDHFQIPIKYLYRIDFRDDDGKLSSMHIRKRTEEDDQEISFFEDEGDIALEDRNDNDDDDWFNELLKGL